jgi:hypothetical protein
MLTPPSDGPRGPTNEDLFRLLSAWCAANFSGMIPSKLAVTFTGGNRILMPVPPRYRCATPEPPNGPVGCSREIMATIREVGHRLTTPGILREMIARGYEWSESTIKHTLSSLVDNGALDNRQDTNPKGYRLPEWV